MNHRMRRLDCALAAALATSFALAAGGAGAQERHWYDGDRRRPLWSVPGTIADFSGRTSAKSQVLQPAAKAVEAKRSSPVFRDAENEQSAKRALPGGVLVRLKPGTPPEAARVLLERHGLRVVRGIGSDPETLLVDAPPGIASLELANRLYESGDFAAASPNWWRPRAHK